jgi:lycopene beta-cyclase
MLSERPQVLIAGGGLAGSLVALALARLRPDVRLLLLEQNGSFGGQHVWSFFDSDVDDAQRDLLQPLITRSWKDHEIAFPARQRRLSIGYNSIRSSQLDQVVRSALQSDQYRLGCSIAEVSADHVVLAGGERIEADVVLDARGPGTMEGLKLGWQKFVGRTYVFDSPHGCERPMIMDGRVRQQDGYRFIYLLPFGTNELMIEDTYYSDTPALDPVGLGKGIDAVAADFGSAPKMIDQETGVLPVVIDGDVSALWKDSDVPLLGIRGGFFHPTTGYSLPDAAANALFLAPQKSFTRQAVFEAMRDRAQQAWQSRRFFPLLNRMLFRAAAPDERYRILEHFYRLPEATIARFYAAELTVLDKARILSGRPPVPVRSALRALRRQTA